MCIKATSPTSQDISPTEPGLELKVFTKEDVSSKPKKRTFFFKRYLQKKMFLQSRATFSVFGRPRNPGVGKQAKTAYFGAGVVSLTCFWAPLGHPPGPCKETCCLRGAAFCLHGAAFCLHGAPENQKLAKMKRNLAPKHYFWAPSGAVKTVLPFVRELHFQFLEGRATRE